MIEIDFSELQNKLITDEKMDVVHAAILAAAIISHYNEQSKAAISDWIRGLDIGDVMIGEISVSEIMNELNCSSLQAVCILDAIKKDPAIFEDAVLATWEDAIIE